MNGRNAGRLQKILVDVDRVSGRASQVHENNYKRAKTLYNDEMSDKDASECGLALVDEENGYMVYPTRGYTDTQR